MSEALTEEQKQAHREEMQKLKAAQRAQVKQRTIAEKGLIMVHTGDGKGKSTSAFGLALRAAGQGMRVAILQFTKGSWKTGELAAFERFEEIHFEATGEGFTWDVQDLERDRATASRGWAKAEALIDAARGDAPAWDMVILDELNIVLRYDYLPVTQVIETLRSKPENLHVVVTGRDAKPELIELADLVTEMRLVKHHWDAGVKAQRGIEF